MSGRMCIWAMFRPRCSNTWSLTVTRWCAAAVTVPVGTISPELEKLLRVTEESLYAAIDHVQPDVHLGNVSAAVQQYVEPHGYSVVRDFVGHGIGTRLHEDPKVPNYGTPGRGPRLKEGMVLAIEPMVNGPFLNEIPITGKSTRPEISCPTQTGWNLPSFRTPMSFF